MARRCQPRRARKVHDVGSTSWSRGQAGGNVGAPTCRVPDAGRTNVGVPTFGEEGARNRGKPLIYNGLERLSARRRRGLVGFKAFRVLPSCRQSPRRSPSRQRGVGTLSGDLLGLVCRRADMDGAAEMATPGAHSQGAASTAGGEKSKISTISANVIASVLTLRTVVAYTRPCP